MTARSLILVIGMHRSGTSFAGSVCQRLGLPTVGRTFPGDSWNRPGYFEAADIVAAHDALFHAWGLAWWDLYDFPEDWMSDPAACRCEDAIVAAIERHAPEGDFFVKDPRASLMLPLWQSVAARLDLRLTALVMMRPAKAVALSLNARDDINLIFGLMLWWRHQREIGRGLRATGIAAIPISYPDACADPGLIARAVYQLLRREQVEGDAGLAGLARPELDHSQERGFPLEDHPIHIACQQAHAAILDGQWPPSLPASREEVEETMKPYQAWRVLYHRHYELLSATRGAFARLARYRPVAGRGD